MPIQCDGSNRSDGGGGSYDSKMHCENKIDGERERERTQK